MFKKGSKNISNDLEKGNVIQAVVIVDSFGDIFNPVAKSASCLVPLVNRPLLDYTLECLSSAGVQEVILFCSAFADQIKAFVSNNQWPNLSVSVVVSEGCRSLGDAMRDLDAKAVIRSDFILLGGDVVGNLRLKPILEKHKSIQKTDKGAAMTLIFKECGRRWKAPEDDLVVAVDNKTGRVLLHNKQFKKNKKLEFAMEILLDRSEVELRTDLMDTQVCVCSASVPPLFSDNFDFQTKDDFVRGILMNEEILGSTLYYYLLPHSQYAASVTNWFNYQSITHDIIHRWVFPQVPDKLVSNPYSYRRNNTYVQRNVTLSQGCVLETDVVIGSGSIVGQKAVISRSVLGKNCSIGSNVILEGAVLFDNVTVEDDCKISYSVIGTDSTIKRGSAVTGCVLGSGVILESSKEAVNMKLQSVPGHGGDESKFSTKAYFCQPSVDEDSDSEQDEHAVSQTLAFLRVGDTEPVEQDWEESSESEADVSRSESPLPDDTNLFYTEVVDSLIRGFEDHLPCDNLVLEINSSRYAYNVTVHEVNFHVVRAILTLPITSENTVTYWQKLLERLSFFQPILEKYVRNEAAQHNCLMAIEDVSGSNMHVHNLAQKLLHYLYDKDILSEDTILEWYESPPEESPAASKLRKVVKPFVEWLHEADEQSDSDED